MSPRLFRRTEHYEDGSSYRYKISECEPFRRVVLCRWSLFPRYWAPGMKKLAPLRALYWTLVRFYDTEICQHCGGPVRVVFHVPDELWEFVTGHARHPDGHAAPGTLCPPCFDELYEQKAPRGDTGYLRWTCATSDWPLFDAAPKEPRE